MLVGLTTVLLGVLPGLGQEIYCVRQGASGDGSGSDWVNAFSSMPSSLQRGATYYIADGSYGAYRFDDPESGTQLIKIKKARASDHGVESGWNHAYGDDQAIFASWDIYNEYYEFDGNAPLWSYGFLLNDSTGDGAIETGDYSPFRSVDNLTFKGVEVDCGGVARRRGVYIIGSDNLVFQNCKFRDADNDPVFMDRCSNSTFEYCYFGPRVNAGVGTHGDAMEIRSSSSCVVRWSKFDWNGQQIFFGGDTTGANSSWRIYGNIFFGGASAGKGLHKQSAATVTDLQVYNCTFVNLNISTDLGGTYTNCLYYDTGNPSGTQEYGYYETGMSTNDANAQFGGDPFVNLSGEDYRLIAATNDGAALSAPYRLDMLGATRGIDGVLDRGAYEYGGGGNSVPSVGVSTSDATAAEEGESNGRWQITVFPSASLSIDLLIDGVGITSGDYSLSTSTTGASISGSHPDFTLNIPDGTPSPSIILVANDDSLREGNEVATLHIIGGSGYLVGAQSSANLVIEDNDVPPAVSSPLILPSDQNYWPEVNVSISNPTPGSTIHYTTDGTVPTSLSPVYTGPFALSSGVWTVKALSSKPKFTNSGVSTQTYRVNEFIATSEWQEEHIGSRQGLLSFSCRATPNQANMDGLFALASGAGVSSYRDNAILVRFSNSGKIDARNGSQYSAVVDMPYAAGTTYEFFVSVNVVDKIYSVDVRPEGSTAMTRIATDWHFRSEQSSVTDLKVLAWVAETGEFQISDVSFAEEAPAAPTGLRILSR